ncbi:glycosyltransferase family 87 protein [Tenuifilum thalassicum]|uniref:DUF2029 domain-containing protein n=1 Tax=Tenuifilum thalassicum TaxID=2590900 RepID=A0A7D4CHL7_9BACT|nr:DUF2029 domain-containing protein [Tenuifilum thalassicum]QKG80626.1 hypothetical protein FHG85_10220 [Tenuifilum thalassicum]
MNLDNFIKSANSISEKRLMYLLVGAILAVNLTFLVLSPGFSGGSFSATHYLYARWAFTNPENFLNSWANPFFTLIAAPFALLGFKSLQLLNVILGILAGYFAYRVAEELNMKSPLLALVICSFTPIFMMSFYGGTTEIMFAFVAILSTFLLLKNRFLEGAILLSFLPLIRLDGLILLPVFAVYMLRWRKAKFIPLMLTGLLVYSVIGAIAGKGFFWLFDGVTVWSKHIYGSGSLSQFVVRSPGYFGIPNEIFFVTGLVAGLWLYFRERKEYSKEFVLVVLPFVVYFLAQSVGWWLGMFNSQGASRYMAAIVPFMAVMATRGLYLFAKMFFIISKRNFIRIGAIVLGFVSIIHIPFAIQNYPISLSSTDWALSDAANYIKENGLGDNKIFYTDPAIFYFLEKNPGGEKNFKVESHRQLGMLNDGDLLVVDAASCEINDISFDSLLHSQELELMEVFNSATPVRVFGKPFFVAIFKKVTPNPSVAEHNINRFNGIGKRFTTIIHYDFDNEKPNDVERIATSEINQSAYYRIPKIKKNFLVISDTLDTPLPSTPLELKVSFRQFRKTSDENLRYFVEVDADGSSSRELFEIGAPNESNPDEWNDISFYVVIHNVDISQNVTVKTGFWNKRKGEFLIDDYRVEVAVK